MSFSARNRRGTRIVFGFFLFLSMAAFVSVGGVTAASRSYSYDSIDYDIRVKADSTVDISERQTYRFVGEYHQGWRNIPKSGIDRITVISVTDGDTGVSYAYSPIRLEKTAPGSFGRYTTFVENGDQVIEWYYDVRDTTKTFVLRYAVSGAIGFYGDHDEFYWNLLTEYDVPVRQVEAMVTLPSIADKSMLHASTYVEPTNIPGSWKTEGSDGFRFTFRDIPPKGKVTIAPGWPKGVVNERSYWIGFLSGIWGYIASLLLVFLTVIALIVRWYLVERRGTGRGTIVPEYDPPKNLLQAMAEVIVTERLTDKAWAATIIDLAVRGFIDIREEPPRKFPAGIAIIIVLSVGAILFLISSGVPTGLVVLVSVIILLQIVLHGSRGKFRTSDYVLTRRASAPAERLEDYESEFLSVLLPGTSEFSTKKMRSDAVASSSLYQALRGLRWKVLSETVGDTGGYEVGFRGWKYAVPGLFISGFILIWSIFAVFRSQTVVFSVVSTYCLAVIVVFLRYNPRLNREGQILREEWLGFKLYLETAERYRMQNLTPETFEKYLSYAIIFGVEKKWGKAFEGISVENPSWYSGSSSGVGSNLVSSGFSAAAFSSSFASSFSSAFASSGGSSGSSGGGGSAGGGGGGGGGGAS